MEKNFIMTAFGKDRPGIAAEVTGVIYDSGSYPGPPAAEGSPTCVTGSTFRGLSGGDL